MSFTLIERGRPPRRAMTALLMLLAAAVLRAPVMGSAVLDPDEGLYLLQAEAWLRGGWPYVAVWDMHPPGAPALLVIPRALIPDPVLALRVAGILAVAATATGLAMLALRLGASAWTGRAAGLLYIAGSLRLNGLATNTEILFAPLVVLVAVLLLGATPSLRRVALAGLAAGIAVWVKQVTVFECSALWLTMAWCAWRGGTGVARIATMACVYALCAGLPTGAMAAGYWISGHFDLWLQGNLLALIAYAGIEETRIGVWRGVAPVWPDLIGPAVLACIGLTGRRSRLLLPWLAAAAVAVAAPGKYFDHYFLILLPPLSLLAAFGLRALPRRLSRPLLVLAVALPFALMMAPRIQHGLGLRGPDPVREVARIAREALAPGEVMYVANWHPIAYALAGRAPPTRYAFPTHLIGTEMGLAGEGIAQELDRVLAIPPRVIVTADDRWRDARPEARAAIEAALADYELIATVQDGHGPVRVWKRL
ncbi:hypothetical protein [Falsiroseomonas sp. HW251]|uniref:hypothetical protein n=1 Tax=Falsiroseomonas sp. HW251 TaxID=3390998 RepID=UPI003D32110B